MKAAKSVGIQYAALPYRVEGGRIRILLITSRRSRRWVIPKGWPIGGLAPPEAAAAEAAEEAGLIGRVEPQPLGSYRYMKMGKDAETARAIQVIAFPFLVEDTAPAWKEQGQRQLRWFRYQEAATRVAEPALRRLIVDFGEARTPSFFAQSLLRYRRWRLSRVSP
ncbi:MAG TPA: NUDIX hydrolase [Caulobacteraceae bacterium]|nr:NUDIX hydrolase [Caulobacteraceae bacterium]